MPADQQAQAASGAAVRKMRIYVAGPYTNGEM